ncbi:restriction endonuclease subunit S [Vibrio alginolyticus]|nr:restriction endonuclease subunit S [Vibrio alginolyticus]
MSCNWPIVKLGDYCSKIGSGATPKGGNSVYLDHGEISLIRSQNIYNEGFKSDGLVYITPEAAQKLKNVIIEPNDVLINITGDSVARVCLAPNEFLPARVNQHVAILRVDPEEFDHRYLRYFLTSTKMQNYLLTIASTGGTRNALTKSMLESLEVSKPSLDVQKRIGDVLESFESKIELNSRTNQTLEEMAQAIFKSWFVDFDPVKAKMNGEQPEGMDAATASLFPEKLVESELGLIPEGWEVLESQKVATVAIGKTPPRKEPQWFSENPENVTWISIKDMGNAGTYALDSSEYLTPEAVDKFNVKVIPDNTLILSFKLTVGRVAITYGEMTTNEAIAHYKLADDARVSTNFLYSYMKQFNFESLGSTSSIAKAVNSKIIKALPIIVPSKEILDSFDALVKPLFDKIKSNQMENQNLEVLRDTLLPKLLSGEIELDVERVNAND